MAYVVVGQISPDQLPSLVKNIGVQNMSSYLGIVAIVVPSLFLVLGLYDLAMNSGTKPIPGSNPAMVVSKPVLGNTSTISLANPNVGVATSANTFDFNFGILRKMEWRRFEIVCAEYLRCMGYEVLEVGFGDRQGVDLEVFLPGKSRLFNVVRCVATDQKVGDAIVRKFLNSMGKRRVKEGMIFSVCGFDAKAQKLAKGQRLALVDGETLCSRVRSLDLELHSALLLVALEGDYTTPTCKNCGIRMVLRRKTGRHAGEEFWGCINHPACQSTVSLHSAS